MWLRRLQLWHITALVATLISVAVFRVVTDSDDRWRVRLEAAVVVVASIWSAMVLVELVVRGESDGSAKDRVVAAYRRLLTRTSFLLASNLVLTVVVLASFYLVVMFRPVRFVSPSDLEIVANDGPGQLERLGLLRANVPVSIRLRVGERHIAFREISKQLNVYSTVVRVTPFWEKEPEPIVVPMTHQYEQVH